MARHLKNPVFSTSLSILLSGRRRFLASTDVVLSSLLRLLIAIPLHLSWTASQNDPWYEVALQPQCPIFVSALYVLPSATACFKLRPRFTPHLTPERRGILLYPPKIGRIADVVQSGRGSEFVA